MSKWRTIPQAAKVLKEQDPETPLTEVVIRRLAKAGEIKSLKSGRWHYVDLQELGGNLDEIQEE